MTLFLIVYGPLKCVHSWKPVSESVKAFDGSTVNCRGSATVEFNIRGILIELQVYVVDQLLNNVDVVLGMDAVKLLGGVSIGERGIILGVDKTVDCLGGSANDLTHLNRNEESEILEKITDSDFEGKFDGKDWTVKWKWISDEPPRLRNEVTCYDKNISPNVIKEFEKEVERWIDEGILVPCGKKVECGLFR